MELEALRNAVINRKIEWLKHSVERMFQRGITRAEVVEVMLNGEAIEDYPDHKPYPSALFIGFQASLLDRECHYTYLLQ